jgi:hypothetical protein
MAKFQVVAVYPSGNRYPVRAPWPSLPRAEAHRAACEHAAGPLDAWTYEVDALAEDGPQLPRLNKALARVLLERAQDGYVNPTGGKTTGRERKNT